MSLKSVGNWFKGFFRTDSPQSMTRLLSFLLVVSGIIYTFIQLFMVEKSLMGIELVTLGLGAKVTQKVLSEK